MSDGISRRRLFGTFVAIGALAAAFVALTALVWETNRPVGLDRAAHELRTRPSVDAVVTDSGPLWLGGRLRAREVAELGTLMVVIPATAVLGLLALAWGDRRGALLALAGPGLTGALTQYVLKPLVNVPAPVWSRSFPSGHAATVGAVALVAVIVTYRRWGRLAAAVVAPLAAYPVVLVGVAVLRLDFHYPTDVLGGLLLAATVDLGVIAVLAFYRGPGHRVMDGPSRRPTEADCASDRARPDGRARVESG